MSFHTASQLPVPLNPSALLWARTESGFPPDRVAHRLNVKVERVLAWEHGERFPTLKQTRDLARFYHRPVSIFFSPGLPQVPPLAAEYRRLPGIVAGHESPELRLALRQMSLRREQALNLTEELGDDLPQFNFKAHLTEDPAMVGARLRGLLDIAIDTQAKWPNEWRAWHQWRGAAERLGVLVFQFGKVKLHEVRGLSLFRFPLPVVGINGKEFPGSKSYTLMHELIHLMLAVGKEEKTALKEDRTEKQWEGVERFAEIAASHALVPESALVEVAGPHKRPNDLWDIEQVRRFAKRFRISPLAMATRLRASGYMSWAAYQDWKEKWDAYLSKIGPRTGGIASPAEKAINRSGRPFVQLVLEALNANRIASVDAARYLDLKFQHFEELKKNLRIESGRSEFYD